MAQAATIIFILMAVVLPIVINQKMNGTMVWVPLLASSSVSLHGGRVQRVRECWVCPLGRVGMSVCCSRRAAVVPQTESLT